MAFMRSISKPDTVPVITGKRVYLRGPQWGDYREWADLRSRSRAFLTPWEPTWGADDLTRHAFRRRLRRYMNEVREDQAYPFFIFREEDDALVGGCTISGGSAWCPAGGLSGLLGRLALCGARLCVGGCPGRHPLCL